MVQSGLRTPVSARPIRAALLALATACMCLGFSQPARAYYIGPSYLQIPGLDGGALHPTFRGWLRAEANYWTERPELREIRGITGRFNGLKFTGPRAPVSGASMLAIAIDKKNSGLTALLDRCRNGERLAEVIFAESADMARHPQEHGPRPKDIPAFYKYRLKDVRLTCPVVDGAPEQAFGLHFDAIEWTNFTPQAQPREISSQPAKLTRTPRTGASRAFVVSWFAPVSDSSEDQCPVMNSKPDQQDYYALMSPERVAVQRAALEPKGGADTRVLPYRGPDEMNVTMLPGIVADPGFAEPQMDVVRGFNLDKHDGTGLFPESTRPHRNYRSPDGEPGIDNQLFTVQGCIEGWRRNGFLPMIGNELRRAGGLSILVEISGIDDHHNDDEVAVSLYYSLDPMRRDGTSKIILPDFTFRISDANEYTQSFARFSGRIVDGVIHTDPLDRIYLHEGPATTWIMRQARMRLRIEEDGRLKALLGGYRDWREYLGYAFFRSSDYENTIGYNSPGLYNAVKRAADGLKDPLTGEFTGISGAYEIEGVPAFIPQLQQRASAAGKALRTARQ